MMEKKKMITNRSIHLLLMILGLFFVSCSNDDEVKPNDDNEEEEVINQIVLTFTPDNGEDAITAKWLDSDGDGTKQPTIEEIDLEENTKYTLAIEIANTLGTEVEDVTAEILREDNEHQFFFEFTNALFSDPTGTGNIASTDGAINYADKDENNLPVGLSTTWTTGRHSEKAGTFRVVLKHQPNLKSKDSNFNTGGTDFDIVFPIEVVEEDHNHDNEEEEVINKVVLTFTPAAGDPVTATFFDADGDGAGSGTNDIINLNAGTAYSLTITLTNTLGEIDEDVTAEIRKEDNDHQFFFGFTSGIFSSPTGDGNIDNVTNNGSNDVNYKDVDENNLPVGLTTEWTTSSNSSSGGTFRVVLKHQPNVKSATSTPGTGGTDIDTSFKININ